MTSHQPHSDIDAYMWDTVTATVASRARASESSEAGTLRVDFADGCAKKSSDGSNRPHRPEWRQRLVEAEHGFAHAIRSESTLICYAAMIAVTALAAGVLRVGASDWVVLGFVAIQSVIVELIRIAIRDLASPTGKAAHVATAASILATGTAMTAAAIILGRPIITAF